MTDKFVFNRQEEMGRRIKTERKARKWTQAQLAEKISAELKCEGIAQSTIVGWEKGQNITLDRLLTMAKLFQCDCGYLLGDYDERTHDAKEICAALGLSEASIQHLTFLKNWGVSEDTTSIIDLLLFDAKVANTSEGKCHKSVLELLSFFFNYDGEGKERMVWKNGAITEGRRDNGLVSGIPLDDSMIEKAALEELKEALLNLKRREKKHG